jgi:hypothetical protein
MILAPSRALEASSAETVVGGQPYPIGYGSYPKGFGASLDPERFN